MVPCSLSHFDFSLHSSLVGIIVVVTRGLQEVESIGKCYMSSFRLSLYFHHVLFFK